jgi:hypothetical protein
MPIIYVDILPQVGRTLTSLLRCVCTQWSSSKEYCIGKGGKGVTNGAIWQTLPQSGDQGHQQWCHVGGLPPWNDRWI